MKDFFIAGYLFEKNAQKWKKKFGNFWEKTKNTVGEGVGAVQKAVNENVVQPISDVSNKFDFVKNNLKNMGFTDDQSFSIMTSAGKDFLNDSKMDYSPIQKGDYSQFPKLFPSAWKTMQGYMPQLASKKLQDFATGRPVEFKKEDYDAFGKSFAGLDPQHQISFAQNLAKYQSGDMSIFQFYKTLTPEQKKVFSPVAQKFVSGYAKKYMPAIVGLPLMAGMFYNYAGYGMPAMRNYQMYNNYRNMMHRRYYDD